MSPPEHIPSKGVSQKGCSAVSHRALERGQEPDAAGRGTITDTPGQLWASCGQPPLLTERFCVGGAIGLHVDVPLVGCKGEHNSPQVNTQRRPPILPSGSAGALHASPQPQQGGQSSGGCRLLLTFLSHTVLKQGIVLHFHNCYDNVLCLH